MHSFVRATKAVAPGRSLPLQLKADAAARHGAGSVTSGFSRDFTHLPTFWTRGDAVQAKRVIHASGDRYELEADRLAEQVMRMPEPAFTAGAAGALGSISSEPAWPSPPLRASSLAATPGGSELAATPMVNDTLGSAGQPLDRGTRRFMESRFGQDFSQVQVHTGDRAAASASAIGARAYASGSHIIFGASQYMPHTRSGRHLLAHELAHVVQQTALPGEATPVQREPVDRNQPTTPILIRQREGITDRIDDAYGKGTLDEKHWRDLLAAAENALKAGRADEARRNYLALYADLAKLAQTARVVGSPDEIHPVTGDKSRCLDARPGLNFSMLDRDQWGANATTAFVDASGKFGVPLGPPGQPQPEVAIVLSRSVFRPEKEQSLGILRHEMIHAGHDVDDAATFALANPKVLKPAKGGKPPEGPKRTSDANSELQGYIEGFMTMFPLTRPAPVDPAHPAFVELLGVLDTGGGVLPWSEADASVRADALGRLQEFYCHALDGPHRASFEGWIEYKSAEVRHDQLAAGEPSPDTFSPGGVDDRSLEILQNRKVDSMGARLRMKREPADFFHGLRTIVANHCKGVAVTKLKL